MDTSVTTGLEYQSGFGNEFATEALPGALPKGRNSPQKVAYGLYAELLSGAAFTAPRAENLRTWLYRILPSVAHSPFEQISSGNFMGTNGGGTNGGGTNGAGAAATPNQLRWDPLPIPTEKTDFVQGLTTLAVAGDAGSGPGIAVHVYTANTSMEGRYFYNSDGEMLLVPQQGGLRLHTEMGVLEIQPNEIAVVPRGIKFRVDLPDGPSRGYVCENFGAALRLPNLGPIGSNGLANPRDFETPVAAFEDLQGDFRLVCKFDGHLWEAAIDHSPLDVAAWHGNYAPYKYDLANFNVIGSTSFDHPDPSIFTVLTSPSDTPGVANIDFVIFPPRWMVSENTYRPPWYHRNIMSEFMGLIRGQYDGRKEGFVPGGCSLHNRFAPHGNDADVFEAAIKADLQPQFLGGTMAFMFETRFLYKPTDFALNSSSRQQDYHQVWQGLKNNFSE